MNSKKYIYSLLAIVCLSFSSKTFSQESQIFTDEKRAEYIFSFSKNVIWKNASFTEFRLGILDKDSLLYYMIESQAKKIKTIHGKPIVVYLFNSTNDILPTEVLFMKKENVFEIQKVYDKLGNNQTLLLTENFPFNKSMINFIVAKGKRNYEINETRLTARNLVVNQLLLSHAVKTKEDWEALYENAQSLLETEKTQNVQKTNIIKQQHVQIKSQKSEIQTLQTELTDQELELLRLTDSIQRKQNELNKTLIEISNRSKELTFLHIDIDKQQNVLALQSKKIQKQNQDLIQQLDRIKAQRLLIYAAVAVIILIILFSFSLIRLLRKTRQYNRNLKQKNIKIAQQNKEITDSIVYARRIQHAILPPQEIIKESIPEHFILFKPRDIVSGDYYWMTQIDNKVIITAADCTGHGVPGAFMSLLGITFLNEIVHEKKIVQTNLILNQLRERIIDSLNKSSRTEDYKDGMDMALCVINKETLELEYSGAYNSLYIIRNGELHEIKADKMPVGLSEKSHESFTVSSQTLQKGDTFYMFSDGYADQFGGPNDKKFMTKAFKELLISIQDKSMDEQKKILDSTIEEWRGKTEQIDDIIVIGIKI